MSMPHATLFEKMLPVIESKIAEFKYYEYDAITHEELWRYCIEKKWRKKNVEDMHLHEIVATIFSIVQSDIVSFNQVEYLQKDDWFADMNTQELQFLLQPQQLLINKEDTSKE